ncbi:MAG: hypothetical protein HFF66_11825 [Oscillospiraceae bacterium]|jgi:hypothetical protein|nr:hypothetical protein [Oscillospiraceae bacterium]
MRKLLPVSLVLCLLLLAGCRAATVVGANFNPDREMAKAQKIVVANAEGDEKAVLETEDEIDAFVKSVNVEGWRLADLPEGLTGAGSFTLWQTETLTALFGDKKAELKEICAFLIYEDGDYLTIDTGFANIAISFSIPEETAAYFRSLTQG